MFYEAKNLSYETFNQILEKPNNSSINYYRSISDFSGLKSITGKIYLY